MNPYCRSETSPREAAFRSADRTAAAQARAGTTGSHSPPPPESAAASADAAHRAAAHRAAARHAACVPVPYHPATHARRASGAARNVLAASARMPWARRTSATWGDAE